MRTTQSRARDCRWAGPYRCPLSILQHIDRMLCAYVYGTLDVWPHIGVVTCGHILVAQSKAMRTRPENEHRAGGECNIV